MSVETATRVNDLSSKLETSFFMVSFLSPNNIYSVGFYVDSGASQQMTFNRKIFNKLHEQDVGTKVEFGDGG
jgi:hypothetical protein